MRGPLACGPLDCSCTRTGAFFVTSNADNGWKYPGWKWVPVGIAVTLILGIFGFIQNTQSDDGSPNAGEAKASASSTPKPEATASTTQAYPTPSHSEPFSRQVEPPQEEKYSPPEEPADPVDVGPQVKYLSEMSPAERKVYDGTAKIAGNSYTSSIWKDIGPSSTYSSVYVVYELNKEWETFIADAGPDSDSRSDAVVEFEVYLDEGLAGTYKATVTESTHIEVDVSGAVQLKLVAKYVSGSTNGAFSGQAAWGSARVEK